MSRMFDLNRLKHIMAHQPSTCTTKPPPKLVRSLENFIERMPPEIMEKIISHLDAGSLFCFGLVNKHFHELADNNAMWYRLYTCQRAKTKTSSVIKDVTDEVASIQEKPKGYWKKALFKELAGHNGSWKKKLKPIHSFTRLPSQGAEVLRSLKIKWEITVKEAHRCENRIKHNYIYFGQASLTIGWSLGPWPVLDNPTTLELHAVRFLPIACPTAYRPGWRSLLSKLVVKKDGGKLCGSDRLISLLCFEKGVTVGIWQKQKEIAFVLMNLHYHKLVERSIMGSSTISFESADMQAPFDDIDPDYGLHGYSMHLELNNTVESIASVSYSQLFCRKDQIADGYIPLQVINKENRSQQVPLFGKIILPWRSEVLQGHVENCCILTFTVLADAKTPFWCVSTPVEITKSDHKEVSYDCKGESFLMKYQDADGKLELELEWIEEEKQFVIVNLTIFLSISKVNRHFGRNY